MRCEAFDNRLQHLLDERQCPEEDSLLAEHAADCPHCRDVLDAQAGLFDTVRDWSVANLEVDLVDRVVARATVAAPPVYVSPSRPWWRSAVGRWTAIAVAAALVMIAWQGIDRFGPRRASESTPGEIDPRSSADNRRQPQQFAPESPPEVNPLFREAAEGLGSRLALGVHYIRRGRTAVTDAVRGQFSRKAANTPGERSSSFFLNAASALALS